MCAAQTSRRMHRRDMSYLGIGPRAFRSAATAPSMLCGASLRSKTQAETEAQFTRAADRIGCRLRGGDLAEVRAVGVAVRIREVRRVGQVERLAAELEIQPLLDFE